MLSNHTKCNTGDVCVPSLAEMIFEPFECDEKDAAIPSIDCNSIDNRASAAVAPLAYSQQHKPRCPSLFFLCSRTIASLVALDDSFGIGEDQFGVLEASKQIPAEARKHILALKTSCFLL